jgi:hypothetical protein
MRVLWWCPLVEVVAAEVVVVEAGIARLLFQRTHSTRLLAGAWLILVKHRAPTVVVTCLDRGEECAQARLVLGR